MLKYLINDKIKIFRIQKFIQSIKITLVKDCPIISSIH